MKIFGKGKKTTKSNAKEPETDLVALVTRIAERLDVLERKMDQVIGQTSSRVFEGRGNPRGGFAGQQPSHSHRHREEPVRNSMTGDVAISLPKNEIASPAARNDMMPRSQGQSHGRREKIMHKAVCADCLKDCEIPFKPTGERPVYCKECFSKRKNNKPPKADHGQPLPAPVPSEAPKSPDLPQRQVSVTKKGVGKVTVSEIVQPSTRVASPKRRNAGPEKKSRK